MPVDFRALLARWGTATLEFLPQLAMIAVIILLTMVVSRRIHSVVSSLSGRTRAPTEVSDLLGRIASIGVMLVGILLVLQQLGWYQAALGFVASLGIAGIAVGFALQDIVKHLAAGVLLLMLRPFRLGDYVKIDAFEGEVVEIQIRATVLKTADGDEILIPNADVYNKALINKSRYSVRRRTLKLQLPREDPGGQLRAAILHAVTATPGVVADPPPAVVATGLEEGAIPVELRFWVDAHTTDPDAVTTHVIAAAQRVLVQQAG